LQEEEINNLNEKAKVDKFKKTLRRRRNLCPSPLKAFGIFFDNALRKIRYSGRNKMKSASNKLNIKIKS
jgi:hypothetical protein